MLGSVVYKISIYVPYDLVIRVIAAVFIMIFVIFMTLYTVITYSYLSWVCGWIFSSKYETFMDGRYIFKFGFKFMKIVIRGTIIIGTDLKGIVNNIYSTEDIYIYFFFTAFYIWDENPVNICIEIVVRHRFAVLVTFMLPVAYSIFFFCIGISFLFFYLFLFTFYCFSLIRNVILKMEFEV